ncbi:MAG: hypothetical protein HZA53_17480 [Planctomycetes bacterium]|nr:hypothetical protein [Planctomycetota bacterium]
MTPLRHLLLITALAALATAGASSPVRAGAESKWPTSTPQRTDSKFGREICRVLGPSRLRGRVHEDVVLELARLGPDAVPALFAYLAGTMEGPEPEATETPAPDDESVTLAEVPREDVILLDVLKQFPRARVVPAVTAAMLRGSVDVKLVGMRVLGEVGGAQAVDAWIDVLVAVDPLHLQRAYVQAPTEAALVAVLESEDAAFGALLARIRTVEPRILPAIVRALGASGRSKGVDPLVALLGRTSDLDLIVLAQLGRLVENTLGSLPEEKLSWVRPFASDADWRVRREAIATLARVQDVPSYALFVAALEDDQRLVAQTALWSLRKASGLDFEEDAKAWTAWFDAEIEWYETEGARWTALLQSEDAAEVIEAAGALAAHPIFRHETARALAAPLARSAPETGAALAGILGTLQSPAALPSLVQALGSEHEGVRTAAWSALKLVTGRDLPLEARAWAEMAR